MIQSKAFFIVVTDIGGSHIHSRIVQYPSFKIETKLVQFTHYNAFGSKQEILTCWKNHFSIYKKCFRNFSFALPGPFDYKMGIAKYIKNNKLGAFENASLTAVLKEIIAPDATFIYSNDAFCFAKGEISNLRNKADENILILTLGTGLGCCYYHDGNLKVKELYKKAFKSGMVEDYFSTRWFTNYVAKHFGKNFSGAKESIEFLSPKEKAKLFSVFNKNFIELLLQLNIPVQQLILGGNIIKAHEYFEVELTKSLEEHNISLIISKGLAQSTFIGGAKVFVSATDL